MSYTEWIKELAKLPKTAEFCLTDVTERISAGDVVLNFAIKEAKGTDIAANTGRRRLKTVEVCRPRMYVGSDFNSERKDFEIEINEPLAQVEKSLVSKFGFSLHEFYVHNWRLCDSVQSALASKIAIISERSAAVMAAQLGEEVINLITKRLAGDEMDEDNSLKALMQRQLSGAMAKAIVKPVCRIAELSHMHVRQLSVVEEELELEWEFTEGAPSINPLIIKLTWKDISLAWNGSEAAIDGQIATLCARDMLLFMVNLPAFGETICRRLAKVMDVEPDPKFYSDLRKEVKR